jgi:hypothetical protein
MSNPGESKKVLLVGVGLDALESKKGDFGNDSHCAELKSRNRSGMP